MLNLRSILTSTILSTTALVSTHAYAADAQSDPQADSKSSAAAVETITVTARRFAENLQDAPLAVSAFSASSLENRSVTDSIGLQQYVPNLNSTKGFSGGSYANYFIRGVGQTDQVIGVDPGVALYVDGVYLGRANGADISTLDLDHIEVLRGPQGTLFGKNTLGGALNVFTHAPTDDFSGDIKTIAGSRNHAELRGWVNVPLVDDKLLSRISIDANTQDGYGYRTYDGHRFGDIRTISGRGALVYKPSESLSFSLQGDYLHTGGTANLVKLQAIGNLGFFPTSYNQYIISGNTYTTNSNYDPGNNLDVGGVSLTANWTLSPALSLKSITAYRALRQKTGTDFDGGPQSFIDQGESTRQNQFSEELQLSGKSISDRLSYVVGGYYYRESADQAVPLFAFTPTALDQVSYLKIENLAAFGQASFKFNDWLSATAGLRFTHEHKDQLSTAYYFSTYNAFYDLGIDQTIDTPAALRGLVTQPPTTFSKSWDSVTPKLSLEAKLTPDVLAYASLSQGFKSGGFNSRAAPTDDYKTYDPEKLTTYEVGIKSELFEHRLRLNLAGFYTDYENVQLLVLRLTPEGAPQIATQNAAKSRIFGFESEATARITPNFEVNTSLGYLNNKYLALSPGAISAGVSLNDSLPQSPNLTANIGGQYRIPLEQGASVTYRADYSYKSKFFYFAASNPFDVQKPFGLVNMRLTYDSGGPWTAALFSNNILNQYYYSLREDVRTSYDIALDWPGEPRTFGIELNYKF